MQWKCIRAGGDNELIGLLIRSESLGSTFAVYAITRKILERLAPNPIFVGTLGTLGQHEFTFGFCGFIGVVEICRVRKSGFNLVVSHLRRMVLNITVADVLQA